MIFSTWAALSCACHCLIWKLGFWLATSRVLCTGSFVFFCVLTYDGQNLWVKTLMGPWNWRPSSSRKCRVVDEKWTLSLCTFRTCGFTSCFVLTVCSSCKGQPQRWMSHRTRALGSLHVLSLLELISASAFPQGWCADMLPFERGPRPAAPRDPPWAAKILEDCVKGLLGFFTHWLSQPCWPGLLGLTRPRTETQGSRTRGHCTSQNPLLHPDNPAPAPPAPVLPSLWPFLTPYQVSFIPVLLNLRVIPGRYIYGGPLLQFSG